MQSLKQQQRFLKNLSCSLRHVNAGGRSISTRTSAFRTQYSRLAGGAMVAGASGYLVYELNKRYSVSEMLTGPRVLAREAPNTIQDTVVTGNKNHAAYIWITLKSKADSKACLKVVNNLDAHIKAILGKEVDDEDEEIQAGVGFGPSFYKKIGGSQAADFTHTHRKGAHGDMPEAGGDIFIHAKSHSVSNLFDLTKRIVNSLPKDSVEKFEDIYSFVYRYGRDLSGFIDGTENPADDEHRALVAVSKTNGGSYLITQKWLHNHEIIDNEKDKTLEGWVGRGRPDSVELNKKTTTSHVARMVGGTEVGQKKKMEIVRQSMPFGTLGGESGLFFIAYAASPENFNYMLDRMVGKQDDKHNDDIMRLSKCVKSTYWYVPSKNELNSLS